MNNKERFYIYCDESVKKGKYFSDFYGGVLVNENDFETIKNALDAKCAELAMFEEIKWTKTNVFQLENYRQIMDVFFEYIKANKLKIRIMFTQNRYAATDLTHYQKQHKYHLLYYQFLKHAFGLKYIGEALQKEEIHLELFFDRLPDKEEKNEEFKNRIWELQSIPTFTHSKIKIEKDAVMEVDSKKHILLQCLDVILGAMAFRLNQKHKEIPEGAKRRGRRTIAKEKLYKHIHAHIREIYPNFNIGTSTGIEEPEDIWFQQYRHWRFLPKKHEIQE